MSLSDRLKRADLERKIAAGLVSSELALLPSTEVDDPAEEAPVEPPVRLELPPQELVSVADPVPHDIAPHDDSHDSLFFNRGASSLCPSCNRPGRVDLVNLVGNSIHLTCAACGAMWETVVRDDTGAVDPLSAGDDADEHAAS